LYGVGAIASNDIWAVGYGLNGTLTEHYSDPCVGGTATPTRTRTPIRTPTNTRTAVVTNTATRTPTATCIAGGTPGPWAVRANYPEPMADLAVASDGTSIYGFAGRATSRRNTAYKYDYATNT